MHAFGNIGNIREDESKDKPIIPFICHMQNDKSLYGIDNLKLKFKTVIQSAIRWWDCHTEGLLFLLFL